MHFPQRLKQLRIEHKYTQRKLGDALSYGSSAIANYESGRNQPSIQDLMKIATKFGVTTDYLIGMSDDPQPYFPLTPYNLDCMCNKLASDFCENQAIFSEIFRPLLRDLLYGQKI